MLVHHEVCDFFLFEMPGYPPKYQTKMNGSPLH